MVCPRACRCRRSSVSHLLFLFFCSSVSLVPLRYRQGYGLRFGLGKCSAAEEMRLWWLSAFFGSLVRRPNGGWLVQSAFRVQDIDLFNLRSLLVSLYSRGGVTDWFFLFIGGSPPLFYGIIVCLSSEGDRLRWGFPWYIIMSLQLQETDSSSTAFSSSILDFRRCSGSRRRLVLGHIPSALKFVWAWWLCAWQILFRFGVSSQGVRRLRPVLAWSRLIMVWSVSNKCLVWLMLVCLALAAAVCSCGRVLRKSSASWSWLSKYLKEWIIGEAKFTGFRLLV